MRSRWRLTLLALIALGLSSCATGKPFRWPWSPPLAKVTTASVVTPDEKEEKTVVTLMTDRPVEVMAYRLRRPNRVAVEIDGAMIDEGMAKGLATSGLVSKVTVFPFEEAEAVRVEMETVTYTDFDLAAEGTRVVLTLTPRLDREKEELRRQLEEAKVTIARMKEKEVAPEPEPTAPPLMNKADAPVVSAEEASSVDTATDRLLALVERWRLAWEERDIDAYAPLYAATFSSGGYDRESWLDRKGRIFSRASELSVGIIDPKTMIDGDTARVVFVQEYRSDHSFDRGWKELTFVREGETWRIVAESWRRLR